MATEHTTRVAGSLARALTAVLFASTLAGCDLIPQEGYRKLPNRERESLQVATNPAPPPVVPGIGGGGGGTAPKLAANAPAGVTQAMVDEGVKLYGTVCSACHGANGQGSPAAPNLNDAEWLNISGGYDEIVTIIKNGVPQPKAHPGAMPPLGGGNFNDEQVRQIAAYIFALSHQGS